MEEKILREEGAARSCSKRFVPHADELFVGLRVFFFFMISLGCACWWPMAGYSWDGPEDNKPATELQEMDEATLAWEAQGPCMRAAVTTLVASNDTLKKRKEALRYLASILAARRKKDGKIPPWLYEMSLQADKGSMSGCNEVAQKMYLPSETPLEGQEKEATAKEKSAPASAEKKTKK